MRALVAGDVAAWVEATAALLPEAGYSVRCADHLLEVAERAMAQPQREGRQAPDLIVLVLSREAWTYTSLIEVLVHELGSVPLVVFTAGVARFAPQLEALGVPVVPRLPFEPAAGKRAGAPGTMWRAVAALF